MVTRGGLIVAFPRPADQIKTARRLEITITMRCMLRVFIEIKQEVG